MAEVVPFLEIDQPLCAETYGVGACTAALGTTGQHKCFNTRATCQDPANYNPTDSVLVRIALTQERTMQYGRVIPILRAPPDIAPGSINLGGMERSAGAFGQREVVNARAQDCKHDDIGFDKYRLERYTGDASLLGSGDAQALHALYFVADDATNPRVTVAVGATNPELDITGDVTVLATILAGPQLTAAAAILRCGVGADLRYSLFYDGTNQRIYFHWYDGAFKAVNGGTGDAPRNQVLRVAMRRVGTTVTFFVNGVQSGTPQTVTAPTVAAANLSVGATLSTTQGFTGGIDGVRVYARGLSDLEIAQDTLNANAPDQTGLVLRWDFDEGSGTTASDTSGNGNDGTLAGTPLPVWTPDLQHGLVGALKLDADDTTTKVGDLLRLTAGAGSAQERRVSAVRDGIAYISPRWGTNMFQYSNTFSNAYWSKSVNIAANGTWWTLEDDNNAGWESLARSVSVAKGAMYILSIKVKKTAALAYYPLLRLSFSGGTAVSYGVAIDTNTGQVVRKDSTPVDSDVGIVDDGDGWIMWVRGNSNNNTSLSVQFYPAVGPTPITSAYNNAQTGALDAKNAQLEWNYELGVYAETSGAAELVSPNATTDYTVHDAYDPYERGTFWGKWLARNPYHGNYRARVRWGEVGQALDDMQVRHYMVDSISGISEGNVTIKLKDLFSKVEARKAVFPFPSTGELTADLTGSPGTFSVGPTGIGDETPANGGYSTITSVDAGWYVCIGDECIRVTRSGDTFTVVQRGALGTVAEDHDDDDLVQIVGSLSGRAHDNTYVLLTDYAGVDAADIPKTEWDSKAAAMASTTYTAHVPTPTPVADLISELMEQAGFTVWADTQSGRIEFQPLIPVAPNKLVTDNEWIKSGTLNIKQQPAKRISRVAFYYGIRNVTEDLKDPHNFHGRVVTPDLSSEDSTQYGALSLHQVFSRWIPQGGRAPAIEGATRLLSIFRDPPYEGDFELHLTRDGELALATPFVLKTADVQDELGLPASLTMVPVKIERSLGALTIGAQQLEYHIDLGDPNVHDVYIENDGYNVNMRTVHDALYSQPTGVETINVYVSELTSIGSTSTGAYALDTGEWPDGTTLNCYIDGRVQAKGGRGGDGAWQGSNGFAGEAGGPALKVRYPIFLAGAGKLYAGGGGGGGGSSGTGGITNGAGGGGGAGLDGGIGGVTSTTTVNQGETGTIDAGGAGHDGLIPQRPDGGDGGGPGLAGQTGEAQTSSPGAGGAAGVAIDGVSLVTFDTPNNLDIRGSQIN